MTKRLAAVLLLSVALSVAVGLRSALAPSKEESVAPLPPLRSAGVAPPRLSLPVGEPARGGQSSALTDAPWRSATTGWQVLADTDLPLRDSSFIYGPMLVAGEAFTRGIATYPFSEIVYDLDERAVQFTARAGVTDDSKNALGSVRFAVYGDEFLLYESGVVRAGQRAVDIEVRLDGLRQLRLVVDDAGDGSEGDYALWAEPRLVTSDAPTVVSAVEEARDAGRLAAAPGRAAQQDAIKARFSLDRAALGRQINEGSGARGGFDQASSMLVLANHQLALTFGYGGQRNGRLSIWRRAADMPTLVDVSPALVTRDQQEVRLASLLPESREPTGAQRVNHPVHGGGAQMTARFSREGTPGTVVVTATLYDEDAALDLEIRTEGIPLAGVRYFDEAEGLLLLGDDLHYLADRSHLYRGQVWADGHKRRAPLEATKPALLWSGTAGSGLLMFVPQYVPSPGWISVQRDPGTVGAALGFAISAHLQDFGPATDRPPPLSIELTEGPVGAATFRRYRKSMAALYPPAPWPAGVRYQWGSWYAYGPAVNAQGLLQQIDLLSRSFGDLGRWQVLVDAGWHVQYGRPDAELGAVDYEKFPAGVRGVTDAAHSRGFDVVLYLGTGFIHDSPADGGEWLALRGLIDRHPDWLIPFQTDSPQVRRFLLDYAKPEVRAYLGRILREFFTVHGADGINLDGLADAEGQLIPRAQRDRPTGPPHPLLPALDIYQLVRQEADRHHPGAFIESGWVNPAAANPYVQVLRYGDEIDRVDHPYPFGGLLQHLDYAIFSRMVLGQRAYIGAASGDPLDPSSRWWVQAAVALGAHAALSFDLDRLTPEATAAYRADLAALEPFEGATTFGPGLFPSVFATTRGGVTYVGVVNRDSSSRTVTVRPADVGLTEAASYTALDVESGRGHRVAGSFDVELPAKSFRLLVLRREPGVLWTDSALDVVGDQPAGALHVVVRGPAQTPGFMYVATPAPSTVLQEGRALARADRPSRGSAYAYDANAGVLTLAYSHSSAHDFEIRWDASAL